MRMHQTICSAFILREQSNLVVGARSLVRIMTLACGAGGPGFKSQRARHFVLRYFSPLSHYEMTLFQISDASPSSLCHIHICCILT